MAEGAGPMVPPPLPLEALDAGQRAALATWFQPSGRGASRAPVRTASGSRRRRADPGDAVQLLLWDQA